jgi:hypothetical protein
MKIEIACSNAFFGIGYNGFTGNGFSTSSTNKSASKKNSFIRLRNVNKLSKMISAEISLNF